MTPERLAELHRAAFLTERAWSEAEFETLLQSEFVKLITDANGFALTRTLAGESELLTLAVHPEHQGKGIGRKLTKTWLADLQGNADSAFLEVASDNAGAIHVYATEGFWEIARRPAYYTRKNAAAADAIVMRRAVTSGKGAETTSTGSESG